jgi:hypothetical protein
VVILLGILSVCQDLTATSASGWKLPILDCSSFLATRVFVCALGVLAALIISGTVLRFGAELVLERLIDTLPQSRRLVMRGPCALVRRPKRAHRDRRSWVAKIAVTGSGPEPHPNPHAVRCRHFIYVRSPSPLRSPALREHRSIGRFKTFEAKFRGLHRSIDRKIIAKSVYDQRKAPGRQ